jgi:hypothetical protein
LKIGNLLCQLIELNDIAGSSPLNLVQRKILLEDINDLQIFVLHERANGARGPLIVNRIWNTFPEIKAIVY